MVIIYHHISQAFFSSELEVSSKESNDCNIRKGLLYFIFSFFLEGYILTVRERRSVLCLGVVRLLKAMGKGVNQEPE